MATIPTMATMPTLADPSTQNQTQQAQIQQMINALATQQGGGQNNQQGGQTGNGNSPVASPFQLGDNLLAAYLLQQQNGQSQQGQSSPLSNLLAAVPSLFSTPAGQ